MFHLIVKGSLAEAEKELSRRIPGIDASAYRITGKIGGQETSFHVSGAENFSCTDLYLLIGRWFHETPATVPGRGFPAGTLLMYNLD